MTKIEVETLAENEFRVRVIDAAREFLYRVTVDLEHYRRLTSGKIEALELVRRSFEFLLKREPPQSILAQFDLRIIERYFPEYERQMQAEIKGAAS